jgi:hypothetical protein
MTNEEIDTKSRQKLSKDNHKQEQQDRQQGLLLYLVMLKKLLQHIDNLNSIQTENIETDL